MGLTMFESFSKSLSLYDAERGELTSKKIDGCFYGVLINACLFFSMVPFFSPVLLDADLQPLIFLLSCTIFFKDLFTLRVSLRYSELIFLFISLFSLVYINPFEFYLYEFSSRLGLFLSFTLFYAVTRYWSFVNVFVFWVGLLVNFLAVILHDIFPSQWVGFVSGEYVNDFRGVSKTGGRGVSGLAPEAGMLGGVVIYFLMLGYIFFYQKKISFVSLLVVSVFCAYMLVKSSSGTGIILFFLFIFLAFLFSSFSFVKKAIIFLVMAFSFSLALFVLPELELNVRGVSLFVSAIENPLSFFEDTSIVYRLLPLLTGVFSVYDGNFIGLGGGSLASTTLDVLPRYLAGSDMLDYLSIAADLGSSAFGLYLTEMGLIFLVLLVVLFSNYNGMSYSIAVRAIVFLFVLASFSIAFPAVWVVLGATYVKEL